MKSHHLEVYFEDLYRINSSYAGRVSLKCEIQHLEQVSVTGSPFSHEMTHWHMERSAGFMRWRLRRGVGWFPQKWPIRTCFESSVKLN